MPPRYINSRLCFLEFCRETWRAKLSDIALEDADTVDILQAQTPLVSIVLNGHLQQASFTLGSTAAVKTES